MGANVRCVLVFAVLMAGFSLVWGLNCKGTSCNDKCVACKDGQGQPNVACGSCTGANKVFLYSMCTEHASGGTGQCIYCRSKDSTAHYNRCNSCFANDVFDDVTG